MKEMLKYINKQGIVENQNMIKKQRGVTLLALVITIAVLAILAGVSVTMITGDEGLVNNAKKVAEDAEKAKDKTSQDLKDLADELGEVAGWIQQEDGSIKKGKTTLHIGDYVTYDCTTYDESYKSIGNKTGWHMTDPDEEPNFQQFNSSDYKYGWRVLGANDKGELLLLSEGYAEPSAGGYTFPISKRNWYCLQGKVGYQNGENELNNICAIYGKGKGAVGARCIKAEDINKITGYKPENDSDIYDKEITYTYKEDDTITYYDLPENEEELCYGNSVQFKYYGENGKIEELTKGQTVRIRGTAYKYNPTMLSTDSAAYKMLFVDIVEEAAGNGIAGDGYWLANPCIYNKESQGPAYMIMAAYNKKGEKASVEPERMRRIVFGVWNV